MKKAKIIISNNYFGANSWFWNLWTETTNVDIHGCWKLDKRCEGKIHLWVEFQNDDCFVRSSYLELDVSGDIYSIIRPIRHRVFGDGKNGPNFSNIHIRYNRYTGGPTNTQRLWQAATTINAVAEMHQECNNRSITPPPHLDIFLAWQSSASAAYMAHYGGVNNISNLISASAGFAMVYLPDILLSRRRSDRGFKRTAFHEMAHASHFTNVGASWWNELTTFEFLADDNYGDGSEPNVGYCSVAESWAYHIAPLFDGDINPNMEGRSFFISQSDTVHHIIPGIHWDLFDNHNFGEPESINSGTHIMDNVSGFTDEMKFNSMTVDVKSINDFKTKLWNDYHTQTGVMATQAQYDQLFESYGY